MAELSLTRRIPESDYYIIVFPFLGKVVFYGTEGEAMEVFEKKQKWENGGGSIVKADPNNKEHVKLVVDEICAVREDRKAGIQNLPYLPSGKWG